MGGDRHMPSKKRIAQHWDLTDEVCWRCGLRTEHLERAHIVDRVYSDNDDPGNLSLLCALCHYRMPVVRPADRARSELYVFGEMTDAEHDRWQHEQHQAFWLDESFRQFVQDAQWSDRPTQLRRRLRLITEHEQAMAASLANLEGSRVAIMLERRVRWLRETREYVELKLYGPRP